MGCALGLFVALGPGRAVAAPCGLDGGGAAVVRAVNADWSLALADGRAVRLAGVDPPDEERGDAALARAARDKLSAWLVGRAVTVVPLGGGVDRWGRTDGLVFAQAPGPGAAGDTAAPLSVALAMVDAGFGRGRPEPRLGLCWGETLAAEAAARAAHLGLWSDAAFAILHPGEADRLEAALGTMALVEGRLARVGRGRSRLFLQLGPRGGEVTVSIAVRDLFILDKLGLNDNRLVGRALRVRGLLEARSGYSIDVTQAEQVEVMDGDGAAVAARGGAPMDGEDGTQR